MRRPLFVIAAALVLAAIHPVAAQSADTYFTSQNQPVILGQVTGMTSHSVGVLTPEGEKIPIEFDSRTVMAAEMPVGTPVRVEFRLLDSGLYLAQRITPLAKGSLTWDALAARFVARKSDPDIARASYSGGGSHARVASLNGDPQANPAPEANALDERQDASMSSTSESGKEAEPMATTSATSYDGQLPSSASELPWVLVTGLLLLIAAGFRWQARRRAS